MPNIDLKTALNAAKETAQKAKDVAQQKVIPGAKKLADSAKQTTQEKIIPGAKKAIETTKQVTTEKIIPGAKDLANKTKDYSIETYKKAKDELTLLLDKNKNGEIDTEDIIILALEAPGVKVNREEFLRKEFSKLYPEEVVNTAIVKTPALAGIKPEDVDKIADQVTLYERNIVTGVSTVLGVPGGFAMLATIPTDVAQYYGCLLRVAQKMLYLYGFQQIDVDENGCSLDTETLNILTICLGVMYGVQGANTILNSVTHAMGKGVQKSLMKKALTKGTIYPLIKKIALNVFDKKITKEIFSGFIGKAIPVVGGIVGGGITFATFKPCCDKLKDSLKDTMLSNPNHDCSKDEDIIDIEADAQGE